jgi:uncharacterized membrane protein YhaH (DUF805 family)
VALIEALLVFLCSLYIYWALAPRWHDMPRSLVAALLAACNLWYAQNYYRNILRA